MTKRDFPKGVLISIFVFTVGVLTMEPLRADPVPMDLDEGSPAPEALPPLPPLPEAEPDGISSTAQDSELDAPPTLDEPEAITPPPMAEAPPPQEVDTPKEPEPTSEARPSYTSRARELRIPIYQRVKPKWGFQFSVSPSALGDETLYGGVERSEVRAAQFQLEYQPISMQSAGVLGIGASYNYYLEEPDRGLSDLFFGMWSIGAQARYQFRYVREQVVVPYLMASGEYFKYDFDNDGEGAVPVWSGGLGLMILLNVFEPTGAAGFYVEHGVARSYLVAEVRAYAGGDENVEFSGKSYNFGLRFEF